MDGADRQVKLRFAPTCEASKDAVCGLGKKHLLDLTLKATKTWKQVKRHLEEKWKGVQGLADRLRIYFVLPNGDLSINLVEKQNLSNTIWNDLFSFPLDNHVDINGTNLIQLFYCIETAPQFSPFRNQDSLPEASPLLPVGGSRLASGIEDTMWAAFAQLDGQKTIMSRAAHEVFSPSCWASYSRAHFADTGQDHRSFTMGPGTIDFLAQMPIECDALRESPPASMEAFYPQPTCAPEAGLKLSSSVDPEQDAVPLRALLPSPVTVATPISDAETSLPVKPDTPTARSVAPAATATSTHVCEDSQSRSSWAAAAARTEVCIGAKKRKRAPSVGAPAPKSHNSRITPTYMGPLDFKDQLLAFYAVVNGFARPLHGSKS